MREIAAFLIPIGKSLLKIGIVLIRLSPILSPVLPPFFPSSVLPCLPVFPSLLFLFPTTLLHPLFLLLVKVSKARLKGVYDDLWAEDAMVTLARFSRQGARQWTDGRGGTQRSEASAGRGGRGREGGGGAMAVDVVVAADMMVYLSELGPLFRAAAGALRTGGIFAFTTESLILPAKPANGDAGWKEKT